MTDAPASLAARVFDLGGAVVVVTGASSGLGLRFARVLAANGARVALCGRRVDALDAAVRGIEEAGGAAASFAFDLRDGPAMRQALDAVEARWGAIGVLVCNAGIAGDGEAAETSDALWDEVLSINLDAAFALCREGARRIPAGGTIITVTSILGLRPTAGKAAYSVAKAGLLQLSGVLALELAPRGIRVNSLAPGYTVTGMNRAFFASPESAPLVGVIPLGRVGQVEDFDGAILLLASGASRFMTGAVLVVDGGHSHKL